MRVVEVGLVKSFKLNQKELVSQVYSISKPYRDEGKVGFRPPIVYHKAIENNRLIVALENSELVGFLHFNLRRDNSIRIYAFVVRQDCVGNGIGTKMLELLSTQNGDSVVIEVSSKNSRAQSYYRHLGFEQVGERKKGDLTTLIMSVSSKHLKLKTYMPTDRVRIQNFGGIQHGKKENKGD